MKKVYLQKINMGSLICIDYGIKRSGLACTDPNKIIASRLRVFPTNYVIIFLKNYCELEDVEVFIIGKPIQKDGAPSDVEAHIKKFISVLVKNFPNQKIERYDERYTSKIALQTILEVNKKKRSEKGIVDQISATLILQSYLKHKANTL